MKSVPLDGGPPTTLVQDHTRGPSAIAIDATNVYWTNEIAGTVKKVPLTGGSPTMLAQGLRNPSGTTLMSGQQQAAGLIVDRDSVYWVTRDSNKVMRFDKNACQQGTCK